MTAANYAACYKLTRQYEGGNDDDPRDPGGRTSRGIIQREYDAYRKEQGSLPCDVWKATESEIADIYRTKYWDAVLGDKWPAGPDLVVWDCAVNSGPGRSKAIAAASLATPATTWVGLASACNSMSDKTRFVKDACARRLTFLQGLRTFVTFGKGWSARVAGMEANGVRMALAAAGAGPQEQKARLERESADAKSVKKSNATVAGGGGVVTGGTSGTTDWAHMQWLDLITAGAVVAGLAVVVVYCLHRYRINRDRELAYAAVAAATPG